jgi:hypothetical protein
MEVSQWNLHIVQMLCTNKKYGKKEKKLIVVN